MPEALAIFHQLKFDEGLVGSLETPFARTKVDAKNGFGMIECNAARNSASSRVPSTQQLQGGRIEPFPLWNKKG